MKGKNDNLCFTDFFRLPLIRSLSFYEMFFICFLLWFLLSLLCYPIFRKRDLGIRQHKEREKGQKRQSDWMQILLRIQLIWRVSVFTPAVFFSLLTFGVLHIIMDWRTHARTWCEIERVTGEHNAWSSAPKPNLIMRFYSLYFYRDRLSEHHSQAGSERKDSLRCDFRIYDGLNLKGLTF